MQLESKSTSTSGPVEFLLSKPLNLSLLLSMNAFSMLGKFYDFLMVAMRIKGN